MKFSCADFTFPLLAHEKVLQLIKLLEIDAVDLGIFEDRSHYYPSEIAKNPLQKARQLKEQLDSLNLAAADVFIQTGAEPQIAAANTPDPSTREQNRETMKHIVEFAVALETKHVTGLPGVLHEQSSKADDWHRMCEEAAWRVELCNAAGLTYAVEPHVGSITADPESALDMLKAVPGLTLTLDYGHFTYQGMSSERVHPLIPYASHFHARGGASGQLQTTVKDNQIDFSEIFQRLKENDYAGYCCLEYVHVDWEGCNRTDNISETIRLRKQIEALNQA